MILDLTWCDEITDKGVKALCSLQNLQHLNLRGCIRITNESVKAMASLTDLRYLDLQDCRLITDEGVRVLTDNGVQLSRNKRTRTDEEDTKMNYGDDD